MIETIDNLLLKPQFTFSFFVTSVGDIKNVENQLEIGLINVFNLNFTLTLSICTKLLLLHCTESSCTVVFQNYPHSYRLIC